jgi:putative FmdB family regulatory protein
VEVMQKITDSPLKKCPSCGKSSLKRLMSAPVFRLKGSGWYETDFKTDQDAKRNLADKAEPDAKDDKKDTKKDDAKPAGGAADAPAADAAKPAKEAAAASDKSAGAKPLGAKKTAGKPKPAASRKSAPAKKTAAKAQKRR